MKKYQYFYYDYIEPIIGKFQYAKHYIQARTRWIGLKLFPPKKEFSHRLNLDPFMLMTLKTEKWSAYTYKLQKMRHKFHKKDFSMGWMPF